MRVLITGAGGAIGVHVLKHLIDFTEWDIVAVDSWKSDHKGYFDRLPKIIEPHHRDRIKILTHDLNAPFTEGEVKEIGDIDYIINLASRSDVQNSIDDPLPFVRNNTELMLNILEYARIAKPKAFLHFSTDEVYGAVGYEWRECEDEKCFDSPMPIGQRGVKHKYLSAHPEWDTILPSNPYSASKAAQEALAIAWWRSYDVPLIITNTMNNFGETQAPSKFPAMIQSKLEKGETVQVHASKNGEIGSRYYIHSRNTADAVLFILNNVEPNLHKPGEVDMPVRLNIVGDKQVDNLELVKIISRLMGKEAKVELVYFHDQNPGHDLHYGLDGTKLKELGWKSPVSFEDSLKKTIDWQKNE